MRLGWQVREPPTVCPEGEIEISIVLVGLCLAVSTIGHLTVHRRVPPPLTTDH